MQKLRTKPFYILNGRGHLLNDEMASLFFQQACKPGSVSGASHVGLFPEVYHLSERPTPRYKASNPLPVYMVFQPKGRASPCVATGPGELLPHLLTLTPVARGGYFLPRYHALADIFFAEVWCSVLPGLSFPRLPGER